ncbi:MAG TPA: protein kinase [Pyrinomonadaceae bacterium]|nr:protein kinase [Pyrinomonadaceae bacterium]
MSNYQIFAPNQKLGEYSLIRRLGEGGFGEVWLARKHEDLFAIKLPNRNQVEDESILREIGLWTLCGKHPNLVSIIGAKNFGGQIAIISEYVPDGSLEDWLRENNNLSIKEMAKMTIGILEGLQFLHENRIIHCDLKPANIILQGDTPRLADFGISKIKKTSLNLNIGNKSVSGTPPYIAPEIFSGKKPKETSDVWAVGVILYQMLSGGLPFPPTNDLGILIYAIKEENYEPLSDTIPPELHKIVEKALQKKSEYRFQSAREMSNELQRFWLSISSEENFEEAKFSPYEVVTPSLENELLPTEPSPIIFEDIVSEAESVKKFENEISEEENHHRKQAEFSNRVKNIQEKAAKFGIPLPDKHNRNENVVSDFEKQVADAEKKDFETSKKVDKEPEISEQIEYFLKTLTSFVFLLSPIVFVFWYFPPIWSLLPSSEGTRFWLAVAVVFLAYRRVTRKHDFFDFLGFYFLCLFWILVLYGVNYLQNPVFTKNAFFQTIPYFRTDNDTVRNNIRQALVSEGYKNVTVEVTKEKITLNGTVEYIYNRNVFNNSKELIRSIAEAQGEGREIDDRQVSIKSVKFPTTLPIPVEIPTPTPSPSPTKIPSPTPLKLSTPFKFPQLK